jgi:hypothetical protein
MPVVVVVLAIHAHLPAALEAQVVVVMAHRKVHTLVLQEQQTQEGVEVAVMALRLMVVQVVQVLSSFVIQLTLHHQQVLVDQILHKFSTTMVIRSMCGQVLVQ